MTRTYGTLTVKSHRDLKLKLGRDVRVLFCGVDVTERCVECDDINGAITLLCGDPEHRSWAINDIGPHIMPDADDRPCVLKVRGDVDVIA